MRKAQPIQMGDDGATGLRFIKPFQLALRSQSPVWVDPSPAGLHEVEVLPEAFGGITWPVEWPVGWGAGLGPGTTFTNTGGPVWPLLTVHGPCTNYQLENVTTGQSIYVSTTLGDGQTLVLDTRARTVQLGDGSNRYRDVNRAATRWWRLLAGSNTVRFRPSTFQPGSKLVVKWRDTY